MPRKDTARELICAAVADEQRTPAEIVGFHHTPAGNIVLEFADAEVIMPGGWRMPAGRNLYVGDIVAAYWDDGRFHIEFAD